MSDTDRSLPRRKLLQVAGIGIGAGLLSGLDTAVQAQTGAANGEIWHQDYWAKKGDVKLNLWRKRIGTPNPGESPRPIVFLVHGSSNSARSSYDLTVPGKGEYSLMNVLARHGYDVWTMDHDGYGYSGSSGNNSDIASGSRRPQGRDAGCDEGNRPVEGAFLWNFIRRHPCRGLCASAA